MSIPGEDTGFFGSKGPWSLLSLFLCLSAFSPDELFAYTYTSRDQVATVTRTDRDGRGIVTQTFYDALYRPWKVERDGVQVKPAEKSLGLALRKAI